MQEEEKEQRKRERRRETYMHPDFPRIIFQHDFGRFLRIIPILFHYDISAHGQLAPFANR